MWHRCAFDMLIWQEPQAPCCQGSSSSLPQKAWERVGRLCRDIAFVGGWVGSLGGRLWQEGCNGPSVFRFAGKVTNKADIYSFGVVIWEICTLERPFWRGNRRDIKCASCGACPLARCCEGFQEYRLRLRTPAGVAQRLDKAKSGHGVRKFFEHSMPVETLEKGISASCKCATCFAMTLDH